MRRILPPARAVTCRPLRSPPPVLLLQAIILGLLQGLTEFLPVSSSGHLQGVPYLLGWPPSSLTFDVMVHGGTLVAIVAYFRSDIWYLATRTFGLGERWERRQARFVVALLAVGTVPAGLAGVLFEDFFEMMFASPRAVAFFLFVTAGLLVAAESMRRRRAAVMVGVTVKELDRTNRDVDPGRREDTLTLRDALAIGVAQAFAIFPGVSRSGATIAAGMMLGLSRAAAARFSFLLAIPVMLGAMIFRLPEVGSEVPGALPFGGPEVAIGMAAAAISGLWAIRFLLRLVQNHDLLGFARYVAIFATLLFAATFWIG